MQEIILSRRNFRVVIFMKKTKTKIEDDKIKSFAVRGEYVMNGDDTFNSAKVFALESALKILNRQAQEFIKSNVRKFEVDFSNDNIVEITKKFLKFDAVKYNREILTGDAMICRAEVKAKINSEKLTEFLRNFNLFKLEKENRDLKKIIEEKDKIIADLKSRLQ